MGHDKYIYIYILFLDKQWDMINNVISLEIKTNKIEWVAPD